MKKSPEIYELIGYVGGVNFIILCLYSGYFLFFIAVIDEGQFGVSIMMMIAIGTQMAANVIGIVISALTRTKRAKLWLYAFVVGFLVVGLVGAAVCFAGVHYFVPPRLNGPPY